MSKDMEVRPDAHDAPTEPANDSRRAARRRLLTTLGAGAAATAALPATWKKPIAESVLLPAHAQTSQDPPIDDGTLPACGGFRIDLVWDTCARNPGLPCVSPMPVDGTLVVEEPGGRLVRAGSNGAVLRHEGDGGNEPRGTESVSIRPDGVLAAGRYRIGAGFGDALLAVSVRNCNGTPVFRTQFVSDYSGDLLQVAVITVDDEGAIESVEGSSPDTLF